MNYEDSYDHMVDQGRGRIDRLEQEIASLTRKLWACRDCLHSQSDYLDDAFFAGMIPSLDRSREIKRVLKDTKL